MKTTVGQSGFDKRQIRDFVRDVKKEAGTAWSMLGRRFQSALIAERALFILGGQHQQTVTTAQIHNLWLEMMVEAGLHEEEELTKLQGR